MKKVFYAFLMSVLLLTSFACCDKESEVTMSFNMDKLESVLPSTDTLDEPYGICSHITRDYMDYPYIDGILDLMDDLNITWVRSDMDWPTVSFRPGHMDYSFYDEMFTHIDKHPNIKLLPIIGSKNSKYSTDESELTAKVYNSDWKEYVRGIISRYHDKCPVWEGFNEWDSYLKYEVLTYADGLLFQKSIYDIAKECDPNTQVLEGSVSILNPYYQDLTQLGFYNYTDFINKHTYSTYAPEDNFIIESNLYVELFDRFHFEKPVWVTEFGYSTSKGSHTEEEQAYLIPRAFISGFARGNSKMFLYSLRSREIDGQELNPESHYGIVHKDLSPKPAYYSVRSLTRLLPSGSTRPILYNKGALFLAEWIHPRLGKVYAIWTKENAAQIGLKIEGNPHCYSYMDVDNELNIEDYSQFKIGPEITYITGATKLYIY